MLTTPDELLVFLRHESAGSHWASVRSFPQRSAVGHDCCEADVGSSSLLAQNGFGVGY